MMKKKNEAVEKAMHTVKEGFILGWQLIVEWEMLTMFLDATDCIFRGEEN